MCWSHGERNGELVSNGFVSVSGSSCVFLLSLAGDGRGGGAFVIDLRRAMEEGLRAHHRLLGVVRFVDVFTGEPVRVPLRVTVPALEQRLLFCASDETYRFVVADDRAVAPDSYRIEVVADSGEYRQFEPLEIALPKPVVVHPPPVVPSDYLHTAILWPTRRVTLPVDETAVVAIVSGAGGEPVSGLRVAIHEPGPPPPLPYTFTDERGELLFRLPGRSSRDEDGNAIAAIDLEVSASDATGPRTLAPSTFTIAPGAVAIVRFTLT